MQNSHAPVTNHLLTHREYEALAEEAKQVEALITHPGWMAMVGLLEELRADRESAMMVGKSQDLAETYRRIGAITGLHWAQRIPDAFREAARKQRERLEEKQAKAEALATTPGGTDARGSAGER